MRRRSFLVLVPAVPVALLSLPATLDFHGSSAKVWLGREEEFEESLRTGVVVSAKEVGEGRNLPKKVIIEKNGRSLHAIFKPIERGVHDWAWECYQAEVVAYAMDRLLRLGMVPPTVERSIEGESGSLQLWVDGCRLYKEVQDETPTTVEWRRQISRMQTFDNLICNPDRHPGNFMVDSEWNIILIDHSQCFLSKEGLNEDPQKLPDQFDRRLVETMKGLRLESLQIRFARLLLDSQIRCILARRDALLARMEKLIAERGEGAVLF